MKYFDPSDFACRCGCGKLPGTEIMERLDQIREGFGQPIVVSSGARCEAWNKKKGGKPKSRHVVGDAVDVVRSKALREYLEANLERYKICLEHPDHTGTDAKGWLHIDLFNRNGRRIFKP